MEGTKINCGKIFAMQTKSLIFSIYALCFALWKILAQKNTHKEVIGGRKRIREFRSSVILIMNPWGCISHGVTARWSIGFLSSLRRDLRRPQAPMESHGPVHLPARSPPRWKLSLSFSLSLALSRSFTTFLQQPCAAILACS